MVIQHGHLLTDQLFLRSENMDHCGIKMISIRGWFYLHETLFIGFNNIYISSSLTNQFVYLI